jgi:hypothetical protein
VVKTLRQPPPLLRPLGLLQGQFFGQRYRTFEPWHVFLGAVQAEAREFFGSDLAGLDQRGELADRVKRQVIQVGRQLHFALGAHFGFPAPTLELHPDRDRVEPDGRRHAVGEREFADGLELSQLLLNAWEQHVHFGLGKVQAHEFLRVDHHVAGNEVGVGLALGKAGNQKAKSQRGSLEITHGLKIGPNRRAKAIVDSALLPGFTRVYWQSGD